MKWISPYLAGKFDTFHLTHMPSLGQRKDISSTCLSCKALQGGRVTPFLRQTKGYYRLTMLWCIDFPEK